MEALILRYCRFDFDRESEQLVPAMALGVEACSRRGVIAGYIRRLEMDNVRMEGIEGDRLETVEVETVTDR